MSADKNLLEAIRLGLKHGFEAAADGQADVAGHILAVLRLNLMRNPQFLDGIKDGYVTVPKTPTDGLINSMCMRMHHDFGCDRQEFETGGIKISAGWTPEEREALASTMRQLYEEVVGEGFYKPEDEDLYAKITQKKE